MNEFFRKLTWLTRRPGKEAELQEELQFHLSEEAEERSRAGLGSAQAHLAARRELGSLALVQEETRAAWSWTPLEQIPQDIRYAFRTMAANRAFSALTILSLALGIGATTAIFSFMDSILLRRLPVSNPESLVTLSFRTKNAEFHGIDRHDDSFVGPHAGFGESIFAWPAVQMFAKNSAIFSSVFGYQGARDLHFASGNQAQMANTEYVTGNYFSTLGVPPAAGRLIMPVDDRSGAASVAVISYALSQRRFGGPESAAGQKVFLNRKPFTVIGVTPPEFFGADPGVTPDVYVPMHAIQALESDGFHDASPYFADPNIEWVVSMARLRPGVSRERAQAALSPQFDEWMRTVNTVRDRSDLPKLVVRDGSAGLNGLRYRYSKPLMVLLGLVALILALACANIANLLLARAAARRREIAVRLGIGAGRWRLIRQLLTESVLLASLGGAAGIAFALWGIRALTALIGSGREGFTAHAGLNWRVLLVVAGLSVVTGVLFGLAPALQATRVDLVASLKESRARSGGCGARLTLSRVLMVAQIAISLVILICAGLFVRTLSKLESIDVGFNRENILTFSLSATQAGHREPEVYDFYGSLRGRLAAIPGVRSASMSDYLLVSGRNMTGVSVGADRPRTALIMSVGPDFFRTMQIPVRMGRAIEERDMTRTHTVAVVNQAFVKRRLDGRNPLGEILRFHNDCSSCEMEIVGVCGNALVGRGVLDKGGPTVFLPYTANSQTGMYFELRTAGNPMNYAGAVRELVREADPMAPVTEVQSQSAEIDGTMNREVIFAKLCTGFALLALAIACVGLYGAMSYNVARRTGEIGIRMALGAQRRRVVWMVMREVLLLAAAGMAVSAPAALWGTKVLKSFLFGTEPTDPLSLAVAAVSLVTAAALAGYLPARNASRIDPMAALRHE